MARRDDEERQPPDRGGDFWTDNAPAGSDAPAAAGYSGGKLSDADFQQWFQSAVAGKPPSSDTLKSMQSEIEARGGKIALNAAGIAHKVTLPGGQIVRVGDHFDSAPSEGFTPAWNWVGGGSGGGSTGAGASMPEFGAAPDPYYSSPWSGGSFQAPELPSWLQGPYTAPTWQGGDFTAPTKPTELQTPFAMPTQAELEASPGYGSRLAAGNLSRERLAAAKGTVLSGGTVKAAERYGQDYASNEYENFFGQKLATRQENVGEYNTDYTNAFDTYKQRYGQFLDKANISLNERQQNAGEYGQRASIANQEFQNNYSMYKDDEARKLGDYLTNYTIGHTEDVDYWNRLNDVANRGVSAGSY